MSNDFQIGKDLGELEARVKALESNGNCNCKGSRRADVASLPKQQKQTFRDIKENHDAIVNGFNEILTRLKLADRVKVDGFTLVDIGVVRDDEDQCCMSCHLDGQSGWQYCCDYSGCSSCC